MFRPLSVAIVWFSLPLQAVFAQYATWQHSGTFVILTTPEGANLPAAAREEGFPLLVRLNKEVFDFSQAKSDGADVRFSAEGKPLAYQIEEWDRAAGTACIWVRIPVIRGNARQPIAIHWGKPDAVSESNGKAVFNESNGFVTVMHLSDAENPVKDEVGTLSPVNMGAVDCLGMIGKGLNFVYGRGGVIGGEKITNFPKGNSPSSTELWFKDNKLPGPWGTRFVTWGMEEHGSKLLVGVVSPMHVQASVDCSGKVALGQWYHVAYTYSPDGRATKSANGPTPAGRSADGIENVYVNGRLNTSGSSYKRFDDSVKMYLGGWYRNWESDCDIDEVRISKVARSADWIKLEYENQQRPQTLVGGLPQPGNAFSVSATAIQVDEGRSATVTAQAGGAQKAYWIVKRDGGESVVAADRYSYTVQAGRVVGDVSYVLQFKAVYPHEVKTKDIPVHVKEAIPEPVFTLRAPAKWNGRDAIEVVPEFANLAAMKAKDAGELHYDWKVSGGAVIKEAAPDRLILKRSQYTGPIRVAVAIDNGGAATTAEVGILVTEPKSDPWEQRAPDKGEKPVDGQFYARDAKNEGTLYYNGVLDKTTDFVFLKVYGGDKLMEIKGQQLAADQSYAFTVKLKPGLIKYKVEFGTKTGAAETVVHTVNNLVCGDAYLIDGQSNAEATASDDKVPAETSDWIRSYGSPEGNPKGANLWCNPVWKAHQGEKAQLGYWGVELAKRLLASQKMPIFMINGAVGGTRIDQHQRNDADPTDPKTIYGRMLWRVQRARLTYGIRAVLWHQGENNQGLAGPTGDFDWKSYQQYFVEMAAAWKQDFPNLQHYYVFQIWPSACGMGGPNGDQLREKQRGLARLFSNVNVMPTLGIRPPGTCHYPLAGWAEFATLVQPLMERDFYGKVSATSITAPNLQRAYYSSAAKDEVALEFDQPVVWKDALVSQFRLDWGEKQVASGTGAGSVIKLRLKEPSAAKVIMYPGKDWSQAKLIMGANGITALTFCDVPIAPSAEKKLKP